MQVAFFLPDDDDDDDDGTVVCRCTRIWMRLLTIFVYERNDIKLREVVSLGKKLL